MPNTICQRNCIKWPHLLTRLDQCFLVFSAYTRLGTATEREATQTKVQLDDVAAPTPIAPTVCPPPDVSLYIGPGMAGGQAQHVLAQQVPLEAGLVLHEGYLVEVSREKALFLGSSHRCGKKTVDQGRLWSLPNSSSHCRKVTSQGSM